MTFLILSRRHRRPVRLSLAFAALAAAPVFAQVPASPAADRAAPASSIAPPPAPAGGAASAPGAGSGSRSVSARDREFLTKAAGGGLYEVAAGRLAQTRGQNALVKEFGAMLVNDHGAANEELKALAARKGVMLPAAMPADKQRRIDKLGQTRRFDQEFVEEVGLDDHRKDIEGFEKASRDADDAEVRAFAAKTLPTLQGHREHADAIKKKLPR
jgi:putative membrane protein